MKYYDYCPEDNKKCDKKQCRMWIDYPTDLNCALLSIDKNGPMKLHQIASRLGISIPRVNQIEDKIRKKVQNSSEFLKIVNE